jgi:hypothetical protein
MSEHDLDALLKEQFDREHQHVPAEPFMATMRQKIHMAQRFRSGVGTALRAAALVGAVIASPWLIAGSRWLNATLASSLSWTAGLPGTWLIGVLALALVLWSRVRSR